nr:hypothetical protein [candidate division Zixibacteria bacterium]NIV14610.1 hypothetical protein [Fodinibius sp.]
SGMNNLGAWSEWKRAVCKADPQVIIAGAERYAAFCRENKIEREYIKYADNWLREELWNNAYELPEKERQLPPTERDELRAEALKWKLERNIFVRQDEKNWLKRWEEKRRK